MDTKEELLKLIWDFKGPEGKRTAEHHAIHLKEYIQQEKIFSPKVGAEELSEMHHIAYMVVSRSTMPKVRDELKPHRGKIYEE
ncbi:hypothetical protein [Salinimicrobium sp. GXAS 041]|uniref:hypothetical protein n=1 Tax=Salinimicrobium sp. GXAS 041 TaxID=3400806 RepID=UPI003C75A3FA